MSTSSEPGAPASAGGIPLCVPEIRGNEWAYIKECLDTNWVSSVGSFVDRFERELAGRIGSGTGIATASGTAALHIALLISGIQPGDEVVVSTLTFIAPANAIRYAHAWPVFVDAEPDYWQMDPQKLADFLQKECNWRNGELRNRATGRCVRAIIPVHILGHPVDLDPILELARRYGLVVIEDATESLGATYRGRLLGAQGDIACFSFNGNKLITTGGGGMILTARDAWAHKARYLTTQAKDDPVEFIHGAIGYNYRLTNLQAAMGCAQLERLDEYIESKQRIAANYTDALGVVSGLTPMRQAEWARSVFWMYTILVDESRYGVGSRALLRTLGRQGIQTRPLWRPAHLSPAHQGSYATDCTVSERLNREALSLPCSVGLRHDQQQRTIEAILRAAQDGAA